MARHPSWKKPLILAALLFGLGTFAYWLEYSKRPADEEQSTAEKKLFALSAQPTVEIEMSKETKRIRLQCLSADSCKPGENAKWQVTEPISVNADDANSNALLQALDAMAANQVIDLSAESPEKRATLLSQYKLDEATRAKPETLRVSVRQGDAAPTVAYFGDRYPIGDGIFVGVSRQGKFDDSKIYVLPSFHALNVDHPLLHWRNKKILTLSQNEVTRVRVSGGKKSGVPVEISRESNVWSLGPQKTPVDGDAIDAWISGIVFLNAKGFAAEKKDSPEAKKILSGARTALAIELGAKDAGLKLQFFEKSFSDGKNRATQLYLTVSTLDPVYELDTTTVDRLDRTARELRPAKLLATQDRVETKWIEIEKGGARGFSQKILHTGADWIVGDRTAQKLRVENLLDRLSNRVIEDFLPAQAPSADRLTLRFGSKAEETKSELVFWKSGGALLARDLKATKPETYRVAKDLAALLPENAEFVFSSPPAGATEGHPAPDAEGGDNHGHAH